MYPIIKPQVSLSDIVHVFFPKKNAVECFEKQFALKIGAKYALAFPYGRSGLYAIFKALEIEHKEVITPAYTCIVIQHVVVASTNKPVFVDVQLVDFNMKMDELVKTVTNKTGAIIVTHLYGNPMDVYQLQKILDKKIKKLKTKTAHKVLLIEDACLSLMNKSKGKHLGTIGDFGIFSFNISKQMTTFDGGMVVTNNHEYYKKVKKYRDIYFKEASFLKKTRFIFFVTVSNFMYQQQVYGSLHWMRNHVQFIKKKTTMESWSLHDANLPSDAFNLMTQMQATLGLLQLEKLDSMNSKRRSIINYYDKSLDRDYVQKPRLQKGINYSHYTVMVENRAQVIKALQKKGINVGTAMDYAVPYTSAYKKYKDREYPHSLEAAKKVMNLPLDTSLRERDIVKISKIINKVVRDASTH
ncbi:DegT/DnrJ/EryC1/StrS family aminotransferase [Candidatus Woesearchaeota archaeon]|nr:DegT/DnrJ/EryC1/StrS family aminotransferase [Candidatus Woesearchaeota archaeon]